MKFQYVVILRKNSEKPIDLLSILLCFCSAIIFILTPLMTDVAHYYYYLMGALILAGLTYNATAARRGRKPVAYRFLLMLAAFGWLMMPVFGWVSLVFGVLAFLEHQSKRPLEIGFDLDRVVVNTLIRRRYDWSVFNNVVLRHGLLTLDFKNNRLFQQEVAEDDDDDEVDEEEFNAWCRERLATG
ncbi:MAG TPA: hypothetical protein VG101_05410 [Puia sp.]|jgi:hypothetical protein|nr:hypothetical protein [Puia sp.]